MWLALLAALAVGLCGCPRPLPKTQVSLDTLVGEYNANAAAVPRLWARVKVRAAQYDPLTGLETRSYGSRLLPPHGYLLLSKGENPLGPHNFVLIVNETLAHEVARVGVSRDEGVYYMWQRMWEKEAQWGRVELAGAPNIPQLPIDPLGLLAVLTVCQLPGDFTHLPTVALTMNTRPSEQYAYVLTYVDRRPITRQIGFRRELHFVWHDEKPRLLFRINFFDSRGRRVMAARVGDYRPIDVSTMEDPPERPPIMPTDIEITWFDDQDRKTSKVHLWLSEMTAAETWDVAQCRFKENLPGDIPPDKVIQVDSGLVPQPKGDRE